MLPPSIRARRWGAVIGLTLCIYLTLPIAPGLWADFSSAIGPWSEDIAVMGMIFVAVAGGLLARRRLVCLGASDWLTLVVVVGSYALGLSLAELTPAEKTHFLTYGTLACLARAALGIDLGGRQLELVTISIVTLIGFGDEVIQYFLPSRVFEWKDVGLNVLSGILATRSLALLVGNPMHSVTARRPI